MSGAGALAGAGRLLSCAARRIQRVREREPRTISGAKRAGKIKIQGMSYLALARKWRPKTFPELVGQEHVLRALVNSLETGRVHHAFLFTGTRGVGKTTIARILAKCLNCETGVTAKPVR